MNKKSLAMKIGAVAFIALMILPVAAVSADVQASVWSDPSDWYATVEGVLASDYYSLYPYEEKSLKVGYSKFGELINSNENVGLEYAGERDPFAAPAGPDLDPWGKLPKRVWINGWYIDIRYNHSSWGYRNVWAGALFADLSSYGGPWIRVDNDYWGTDYAEQYEWEEDFRDPGLELDANGDVIGTELEYGGRKTNGSVVTEDPVVLYDGPRRYVVQLTNHIYDYNEIADVKLHLVDVIFTIIFNKVKKEVIVLKDVKYNPQAKFDIAPIKLNVTCPGVDMANGPGYQVVEVPYGMVVQFSNREEWDLGTDEVEPKYASYVHFYTQGVDNNVDTSVEGLSTVYNDDWTILPTLPAGYSIVGDGSNLAAHGSEPGASGTYDVAQIISNDEEYVAWAAYWPSLSDWSADAGAGRRNLWWRAMTGNDPHDIDSAMIPNDEPFLAPLTIGEWDFVLSESRQEFDCFVADQQFRGVTVYGVTDLNDGEDADMGAGYGNVLDTEVMYQLKEVFNPWDLLSAVHKATKRWVEFDWDSTGTFTTSRAPVVVVSDDEWDDYCVFSERVIDLTTGEVLDRSDYSITLNSDGTATISGLTSGHDYKILYSTRPEWSQSYTTDLPSEFYTFSGVGPGDTVTFTYDASHEYAVDPLGVIHGFEFDVTMAITVKDTVRSDFTESTDDPDLDGVHSNFKVFKGETFDNTYWFWDNITYTGTNVIVTCVSQEPTILATYITSTKETVHIDILDVLLHLAADISYNYTTGELNVTFTPYMGYYYEEHMGGRYEWTIVGRDAASVDSVGAALVTAAYKNKQVEIGTAGEDMYDPELANYIPWVMSKMGAGDDWADYLDDLGRAALKDDWCTYWPISSSNMIGVGGPLANLLAYYGNDFTEAFFGLTQFTPAATWSGKIAALTCWSKNSYASDETVGYAVISTYKDINGTVIFLVWGHWGRDTFYASQWLHGDEARGIPPGIHQLQEINPGVTSIILKIDYTDPEHPTFSVIEHLGTISEKEPIHPDP